MFTGLPSIPASFGEFADATFRRDGKWLFVNIQTPGVSFAITGPWSRGSCGAMTRSRPGSEGIETKDGWRD
jgi:secreted PhoX family phosphatase